MEIGESQRLAMKVEELENRAVKEKAEATKLAMQVELELENRTVKEKAVELEKVIVELEEATKLEIQQLKEKVSQL